MTTSASSSRPWPIESISPVDDGDGVAVEQRRLDGAGDDPPDAGDQRAHGGPVQPVLADRVGCRQAGDLGMRLTRTRDRQRKQQFVRAGRRAPDRDRVEVERTSIALSGGRGYRARRPWPPAS